MYHYKTVPSAPNRRTSSSRTPRITHTPLRPTPALTGLASAPAQPFAHRPRWLLPYLAPKPLSYDAATTVRRAQLNSMASTSDKEPVKGQTPAPRTVDDLAAQKPKSAISPPTRGQTLPVTASLGDLAAPGSGVKASPSDATSGYVGAIGSQATQSVPPTRRTSGADDAFGMDRLSLSATNGAAKDGAAEDDAVYAEGAQKSVQYLQLNTEDDGFLIPQGGDAKAGKISTSSAALDLAPLAQTSQRFSGKASNASGLKTSEWPQFSGPPRSPSSADAAGKAAQANGATGSSPNASRRTSPSPASAGVMADSVASLPAMPSRSVPGTPAGPLAGGAAGLSGMTGMRRQGGVAGGSALEGLSATQRGYSNPDLAKAFSKSGYGGMDGGHRQQQHAYGMGDPLYTNQNVPAFGNGGLSGVGYDNFGFDDDNFGGGMLYPGGHIGSRNKRAEMEREFNRFAGMRLEDLQGEILTLCKDQHGCRYLQKKLEEEVPEQRDMIFRETYGHFPELMTDPFGNYLCQKLLEYSTEEQRNVICESVANDLVAISLNMHGTRAVQKMIDFLSNPRQAGQIRSIIMALSLNVVALIKDLNGNHVIQKCLNRLIPEDNQFIYNAVAQHCVEVATHRHGCCVLQRCIDHAADSQRVQLVTEITFNALTLVQDPFGNYVVQYVLDLNDHRFSEAVIRQFIGNVCILSVQKFSSNVIEKCIRVADPELRKILVGELLNRSRLEKLLRDSFANYVVQTALDYAEPSQRMLLVDCIRPILPMIRNTPYGKRIQSKLQREQMGGHFDPYSGGGGGGGAGGNYGGHGGFVNLGGGGGYGGNNGFHRGGYNGGGHHRGGHPGHPGMHGHHPNAMGEAYGRPPHMSPWEQGRGAGGGFGGGLGGGARGFPNGMNGMHQPQAVDFGPGAGFEAYGPQFTSMDGALASAHPQGVAPGTLGNGGHFSAPGEAFGQPGGAQAEGGAINGAAGGMPYGQAHGQYGGYM